MSSRPLTPPEDGPPEEEPLDLPEVHSAQLGAEEIDALFRDLAQCVQVTEIIPKFGARERVPEGANLTLDIAKDLLLRGGVRGLQVRYRYQGADWWDTMIRTPDGYQLVRIRHNFTR